MIYIEKDAPKVEYQFNEEAVREAAIKRARELGYFNKKVFVEGFIEGARGFYEGMKTPILLIHSPSEIRSAD